MTTRVFVPGVSDSSLVFQDINIIESFIEHNKDRLDIELIDNGYDADLVVLFEQYSFKQQDYTQILENSELIEKFANKLYVVNYDDVGQGFLPGCYTSLTPTNFDPRLHRSCAYPKTYNEIISVQGKGRAQSPRILFSFRGNLKSHPLRVAIEQKLGTTKAASIVDISQTFGTHSNDQKNDYIDEMLDSQFVLCPRGSSPATYRLFESMQLGRCPVIVSDEWLPIKGINWSECSITVREKDIANIPSILNSKSHQWRSLGENAAKVWQQHFSDQAKNQHYLDFILELHSHSKLKNLSPQEALLQQSKRWKSWSFSWGNSWTLPQKLGRRISKIL